MAVRSRNVIYEFGLGKSFSARLSVVAARVFSFFAYHTPLSIGYFLADLTAVWMFLRFHNYRRTVMSNLRHVYGNELPEREIRKRARWVFRTSLRNFWDLASLPRMDRERLESMHYVEEGNWEIIDDVMAKGSGAILISAHLGAFDFIGQYVLTGRHQPLVLTAATVPDYLFAGVMYWRSSLGVRFEVLGSRTIRHIVQAIRRGRIRHDGRRPQLRRERTPRRVLWEPNDATVRGSQTRQRDRRTAHPDPDLSQERSGPQARILLPYRRTHIHKANRAARSRYRAWYEVRRGRSRGKYPQGTRTMGDVSAGMARGRRA